MLADTHHNSIDAQEENLATSLFVSRGGDTIALRSGMADAEFSHGEPRLPTENEPFSALISDASPKLTARMVRWVKNSCLYRLNQKMMSQRQLFAALARRAQTKFEEVDIALARQIAQIGIDFCNENNFLNDANFAETKVASGSRGGKSRRRLAMELKKNGIDLTLVHETVEMVDDMEAAINYARKRAFGPFRKVELDTRRKAREFAAFARNGFEASVAMKVIAMASPQD